MADLSAPWLQRAFVRLLASADAGRLAHALLICGPAGLGKRELASALVARLLCLQPAADGGACGNCRGCQLRAAGSHPDQFGIRIEAEATQVRIEQIRTLGERLQLSAQLGEAVVADIDPADGMNNNASNALLKTLEEPQPGRYLILVSDHPYRLSATIRSRCQRVELRAPPLAEALDWLVAKGHTPERARSALQTADGLPGAALQQLGGDHLQLATSVERDLAALAEGRAGIAELSRQWLDDRPQRRLMLAADWVRQLGRSEVTRTRGDRLARFPHLANWYDHANRTRQQLDTPLRAELLMADLLHAWVRLHQSGA
jgi:DNA polymerase-3 subunit delta'